MNNSVLIEHASKDASLAICLLGRFRVRVDNQWIESDCWNLRKAKQLMVLLALAPDHRIHREHIIEHLWSDFDPRSADNNFRRTLHETRRTLAPTPVPFDAHVRLQGCDVVLVNDSVWVDTKAFESATDRAKKERTPEAFKHAISLYGGDLVPEERYNEWVSADRERLRSVFLNLWFGLAQVYESQYEYRKGIQAYLKILEFDIAYEEAHTRLMRLYARTGQRHHAIRQYKTLKEVLRRELDVDPTAESRILYEKLLNGQTGHVEIDISPRSSSDPEEPVHNLPTPLMPFIERSGELETVTNLLGSSRLVTLTGTGGTGKSRFGLEVARRVAHRYKDGTWLVDLSEVNDPKSVPQAIAAVLGVATPPNDITRDHNRSKHQLIILDNCEHVAEACQEFVSRILPVHFHTHVLATSRQALSVPGEVKWCVPPLSVPDTNLDLQPNELREKYSSIALFMQYATRIRPDFELTRQNTEAVITICRKLDGNPLAIKLAANRVQMLTPIQIVGLLHDPFRLLTSNDRSEPHRHRTLRAAFDWSYDLLSPNLQKLFKRLSVLENHFALEEAAAVTDDHSASDNPLITVLDDLSSLAAQSLILAEANIDGTIKYRMPAILQQYARSRLRGVVE